MKERFAALATDAVRAAVLELSGYKAQILEFIDLEHTAKNLLIRAVRQSEASSLPANQFKNRLRQYEEFKRALGIERPYLEQALGVTWDRIARVPSAIVESAVPAADSSAS